MKDPIYVFPAIGASKWRPPRGISDERFADLHSMENMAQRGHESWSHTQLVTHRLSYFPGLGLPENGISTLEASAKRGHRNHEFDIVTTKDGHVGDHDFSAMRTTGIEMPYSRLSQGDVLGTPILIRQFQKHNFAPVSTTSNDKLLSSVELLRRAREIVPKGSFFADCRDNDVGIFAAWISRRPEAAYTLVMFYTFTIFSGPQLVAEIERHQPDPQWRDHVKIVHSMYPRDLLRLAEQYVMPANSIEDLVLVGKKFLTSLSKEGVPLFALLVMCSGIEPTDVDDMDNDDVRRAVFAELAIITLVEWARTFPGFNNLK